MKNQDLVESFSGIRGIYGQGINEELVFKYGWFYCQLFQNKSAALVIGGDTRNSTPNLKKAIIRALKEWGVKKIIDVGIVPIQVCEYAIIKFKASGGVYITASHNEPEYNGWKFLKEDGALLYPEQINQLIEKVRMPCSRKVKTTKSRTKIINKNKEIIDEYINFVLKRIGQSSLKKIKESKFKILVDPNGGSGIAVLRKLFKELGVRARVINNKLGKFVRLIEPNVKSLDYLGPKIDKGKFEFACGFDCDADRIEFVVPSDCKFAEEMGKTVSGQYILALVCDVFLEGSKNQIVITNDCTSYLVRDVIKKYQARIKEVEVGEMNIVKEMEKQKSIIGGEGSCGGVIIPPIKCRDGIMSIVLILKMMAERKKSLTDILEDYPKYYSERAEVFCSNPVDIKKKIENYFQGKKFKTRKTGGVSGGFKILFDRNSYLWFRQSKTEAGIFRIITDGDDYQKVTNSLKEGIKLFNKFKNQ